MELCRHADGVNAWTGTPRNPLDPTPASLQLGRDLFEEEQLLAIGAEVEAALA
jgi:hypothetical protein